MEDINIDDLQRRTDRFVITARELSSRGASFLIVMLGVLLQTSHTALLMYDIAAFKQEWMKIVVGIGIGIFISSALAVFTLKHDGKNKEIGQIITVFFYFEIFTNVFYYWNSLIFSKGIETANIQNWLYLIIAMPFSFIMPFAIKKFAGVISADERLKFGSIDVYDEPVESNGVDFSDTEALLDKLMILVNEDVDKKLEDTKKSIDSVYLKKGSNIELSVNGNKTVVSLGDSVNDNIDKVEEDSDDIQKREQNIIQN